jgi:hypothetical protein
MFQDQGAIARVCKSTTVSKYFASVCKCLQFGFPEDGALAPEHAEILCILYDF